MLQLSVGILNVWDFTFSSIMIPSLPTTMRFRAVPNWF
jgi:hypothetical protein